MTELIHGEAVDYLIPPERKECCSQCDPDGTDRRARRQMKSGQDTVRCYHCGRFLYCIPKSQSGLPHRTVKTRPDLDISMRAFVLERDRSTCLLCGRRAGDSIIVHVAHIVSIDDCKALNIPEDAWNAEYNLCTLCEECNLSQGGRSFEPSYLMARLVIARRRWVNHPKFNPNAK